MARKKSSEPVEILEGLPMLEGEPPEIYAALVRHVSSGPTRTLASTAKLMGVSSRTALRWAQRWDWLARAGAWEASRAVEETRTVFELREAVRTAITEATPRILTRLIGWLTAEETKASTGIPGALRYLELAGFTPPKRIELDVDDRRDKAEAAAAAELETLTAEELARLDEVLDTDTADATE